MEKDPRNMDALKETPGHILSLSGVRRMTKKPLPLAVHFARPEDLERTDPPYNQGHLLTRETAPGDPGVRFQVGDAIVTGTQGEVWPIARDKFESTYRPAEAGLAYGTDGRYYKDTPPSLGRQMEEPFTVTASWGNLVGKPGDWLVQYDEQGQDFGVVGRDIAEETYTFGEPVS